MFTTRVKTYLVVGLGNPDRQYLDTFHNTGYMAVDAFAKKLGVDFTKGECRAVTASYKKDDVKVIIAKPVTYMNLSGECVVELINKYKIEQDKFIVVYDDVDLPIGHVRIRMQGSAGTHNGMRNIVTKTGSQQLYRIRVGIGQEYKGELFDYVLSRLSEKDKEIMSPAFATVADALQDFVGGADIEAVMRKYN